MTKEAENENSLGMADFSNIFQELTKGDIHEIEKICHVFYPSGKPRIPHILCCLPCRSLRRRLVKGSR